MKTKHVIITILAIIIATVCRAQDKEPYAVIDDNDFPYTLTLYYDDNEQNVGDCIRLGSIDNWATSITKIIIDKSMKNYRSISCRKWFAGLSNLRDIVGMEYLNTEDVYDMSSMFAGCRKLKTIDLSHFNTANVKDMRGMFSGCSSLETLDLSSFGNIDAQQCDVGNMFANCHSLKTIYANDWKNIEGVDVIMFVECNKLYGGEGFHSDYFSTTFGSKYAHIDVKNNPGYFTKPGAKPFEPSTQKPAEPKTQKPTEPKTQKPAQISAKQPYVILKDSVLTFYYGIDKTGNGKPIKYYTENNSEAVKKAVFDPSFKQYKPEDLSSLFANYVNMTEIIGMEKYLNTSECVDMNKMFYNCLKIKILNLGNFDTRKTSEHDGRMNYMFYNCRNLETIFVNEGFAVSSYNGINDVARGMFDDCIHLHGGNGTRYSSAYNLPYIDYNNQKLSGYFTKVGTKPYVPKDYAVFNEGTLTLYYGENRPKNAQIYYLGAYDDEIAEKIQRVAFDPSFRNYAPKSCSLWFYGLTNLKEIVGMKEKLNTQYIEDMSQMFSGCKSLETIDLSGLRMPKLNDMGEMFYGCENLVNINLNDIYTEQLLDISRMFQNCKSLESFDLGVFKNQKIGNIYSLFSGCENLKTVTSAGFNAENITSLSEVFRGCTNLTTVDLSAFKSAKLENTHSMFQNCKSLKKFSFNCFNTEKIYDMSSMFLGCTNLETIDMSAYQSAKQVNIICMFSNCINLKTIYASSDWDPRLINNETSSFYASVFRSCNNLFGGKGTRCFDDDPKYARIDGGEENPGYFTKVGDTPYVPKEYAVYNDGTLTLYYSENRPQNARIYNLSAFGNITDSIQKVIFDPSFKNFYPKSCAKWFKDLYRLKEIVGMNEYLNTEKVEDMNNMFAHCSSLETLDLSKFNTANVKDMTNMFYMCGNLKTIFVSDLWYKNAVKNGNDMFSDCYHLYGGKGTKYDYNYTNVKYARIDDGENFPGYFTMSGQPVYTPAQTQNQTERQKTAAAKPYIMVNGTTMTFYYKVPTYVGSKEIGTYHKNKEITTVIFDKSFKDYKPTDLSDMFSGFENLTKIVNMQEYLNTEDVTDMGNMFANCKSLKQLDLSNFDTRNVTYSGDMFYNCTSLTTVYIGDRWFDETSNCPHEYSDCIMIDGHQCNFVHKNISKTNGYAILKNSTLTFSCGKKVPKGAFVIDAKRQTPQWNNRAQEIKKVVFTKSFAKYKPQSCYEWFSGCSRLTEIVGMRENLNTSEVRNMAGMFMLCCSLQEIDLAGFDTQNVITMHSMFSCCKSLTSLNLSSFNTGKVRNMALMFDGCENLQSLDIHSFNTAEVVNMGSMFFGCRSIESLDLKHFNTASCENWAYMFGECTRLKSVDVSSFDTKAEVMDLGDGSFIGMFEGCQSLTDLDVSNFVINDKKIYGMFLGCSNLKNLKLFALGDERDVNEYYHGDISGMFCGCKSLEVIDLSNWYLHTPSSMNRTFADCASLKTIYVSKPWILKYMDVVEVEQLDGTIETITIEHPSDFYHVFYNCLNLTGGAGTKWNSRDVSSPTYIRIDSDDNQPGYFTQK